MTSTEKQAKTTKKSSTVPLSELPKTVFNRRWWWTTLLAIVMILVFARLGVWQLDGTERVLLIVACVVYLLGVQFPTITINIPLNNELQSLDLDAASDESITEARTNFESRWIRWNSIRTAIAIFVTTLLLFILVQL